jgi:hypothetical protein
MDVKLKALAAAGAKGSDNCPQLDEAGKAALEKYLANFRIV